MNFIETELQSGRPVRGIIGTDVTEKTQTVAANKNDITIACGLFMCGLPPFIHPYAPPQFRSTMDSQSESPATIQAVLAIQQAGHGYPRAILDVGARGSTNIFSFPMSTTKDFPYLYKTLPKGSKLIRASDIKSSSIGLHASKFQKIKEMAIVIEEWGSVVSHNPFYLQVNFKDFIKVDNISGHFSDGNNLIGDIDELLVNVELAVPRFIGDFPRMYSSGQLKNPKLKNGYMLAMLKPVIHASLFNRKMTPGNPGYAGTVQYLGAADVGFFQTEFIYNLNFSVVSYDKFRPKIQPLPPRQSQGLFLDLSVPEKELSSKESAAAEHDWIVGNWFVGEIFAWIDADSTRSLRNVIIMLPKQRKDQTIQEHKDQLNEIYSNHEHKFRVFYYAFDYADFYIKHISAYGTPYDEYFIPLYDDSFGSQKIGGIDQDARNQRWVQSHRLAKDGKVGIFKYFFPEFINQWNPKTKDFLIPAVFGGVDEVYLSSSIGFENMFFENCLKKMPVVGVNSLSNSMNLKPLKMASFIRDDYISIHDLPSHLYMTVRYSETQQITTRPSTRSIWSPDEFRYDWTISQSDIRKVYRKAIILPLAAFTALAGKSVTNRSLLLLTTNPGVLTLDIGSVLAKGTGILLRALTGLSEDKYYAFRREHISYGQKMFGQLITGKPKILFELSGHLFSMLFYPCSYLVYHSYIATAINRKWHTMEELQNSFFSAISIAETHKIPMHHLNVAELTWRLDFPNTIRLTKCSVITI